MAETTNVFTALLGTKPLQKHNGDPVDASTLSSKSHVLFYFSAHWCPPCRGFTPQLSEYYKKYASKFDFEIVFVSSDKEEKSFNEYWEEMPWLALPYSERDVKGKLSQKYKVSGIPSLVVLNNNGEIVNKNGRGNVTSDPEGFPWKTKTLSEILTGEVKDGSGQSVDISTLKSNTVLGLYFSAHWCPPCRGFTPKLKDTYTKLTSQGKKFEVIFATSDNDEASFKEYFGEMPWKAFPFKDKRIDELSEFFEIEGIPALVLLDPSTGKVIRQDGREAVSGDPEGTDFPWFPKATNTLESGINATSEGACLIVIDPSLSDDTIKLLKTVGASYWDQWKAAGKEDMPLNFLYGKSEPLVERVLTFTNTTAQAKPLVFILDIPSQKKYLNPNPAGEQLTEQGIKSFVDAFVAASLKGVAIKE